jgi:2-aminoethylphosphonate-pyruvate transaminase
MAWLRSAVILGAGVGSRLRSVLQDKPKGFLQVGDVPIVEEAITKLIRCGVQSVVIVAGYKKEFYEDLARKYPFVTIVVNPDFASTGSMYSLYCARDVVQADFLLVESDVIFEIRGVLALQNSGADNSILLSGTTGSGDEVYVGVSGSRVTNLSKDPTQIATLGGELVGVSRISMPLYRQMCLHSERAIASVASYHYEDSLTDSSRDSVIGYELIEDLAWTEVDDPSHLERARNTVYPLVAQRDTNIQYHKRVDRRVLLNPGPATTTDSVKLAMVVEDICPRESEFGDLVEGIRTDLVAIVHGRETHEAVLFASSGTGAVEACLSSVVPHDKAVLIISNGAYGKRMQEICDGFGVAHVDYNVSWGDAIQCDMLESLVEQQRSTLSHIAFVHHETTIGILNPIEAVAAIAHAHGLELIVDAMSSFAGIPIDVRTSGVEYLISSSNKCIQGMAGVSFVLCNRKSLEATQHYPIRNYYFNLYRNYRFFRQQRQMQFTPPVQILYALRQAINEYVVEGELKRFERYDGMYKTLCEGLRGLGFQFLVDEAHRARILTAIIEPGDPRYSFETMHDFLYARGFTIYPGKGAKQDTFRLATMGALTNADIEQFLVCLREYLVQYQISMPANVVP